MALDLSLYKLITDASTIITDASVKMTEIASEAIDCEGSPKQPRLLNQLVHVGILYEQAIEHMTLSGNTVTAIVGENVEMVNRILIRLKKMTAINL